MAKEVTPEEIAKAGLAFNIAFEMLSPKQRKSFRSVGESIVAVASRGANKRDLGRLESENQAGIDAGRKLFQLAEKILDSGQG